MAWCTINTERIHEMRKSSVERVSTKRMVWYVFGIIAVLVAIGFVINDKYNPKRTQLEAWKKSAPATRQIDEKRAEPVVKREKNELSSKVSDDELTTPPSAFSPSVGTDVRLEGSTTSFRKPDFLIVSQLPNSQLFYDMDSSKVHYSDITELTRRMNLYRDVVRNSSKYSHLVDDDRIFQLENAKLIYQLHCYRFFKYGKLIDDMKADFMGGFLSDYHNLTPNEIDRLVIEADEYVD